MKKIGRWLTTLKENFDSSPLLLKALIIFSYLVSLTFIFANTFFWNGFNTFIYPFTEFNGLAEYSIIAIYFTFYLSSNWKAEYHINYYVKWWSVFFLLKCIYVGLKGIYFYKGGYPVDHYLYRHPQGYIWSVVIPAFWLFAVLSLKTRDGKLIT